jgi:hypothetical protein
MCESAYGNGRQSSGTRFQGAEAANQAIAVLIGKSNIR